MDIPIALHIMIRIMGYLKTLGKYNFLNFHKLGKQIPCTRTIIYNKFEQMNLLGDILNDGDNADGQADYGFTVYFFKYLLLL